MTTMNWRRLATGLLGLGIYLKYGIWGLGFLAAEESAAEPPAVAATIDGQPVYAADAEHEFNQAYRGRKMPDDERRALLAAALEQVIDRRLVLRNLVRTGQAASDADVSHALALLEKQLMAQQLTLAEHLREIGRTVEQVRAELRWKLSWQKYLAKYVTDENLQKYFDKHRAHFDGTQLRVAHILLKSPEQAGEIREDIAAGKLTFAEAARQHSAAPTGKAGGDIGWIERHQPMPEAFSQAAFDLAPGEVSRPVASSAGVHLIQVLEIQPGQRTWQEASAALRPAVAMYLFRWLADQERATAKIERTGAGR
jgi:peptidyl-prolyl cis-trans isomerase C